MIFKVKSKLHKDLKLTSLQTRRPIKLLQTSNPTETNPTSSIRRPHLQKKNTHHFEIPRRSSPECLYLLRNGWKDVEIREACHVDSGHQGPDRTTNL